MFNAFSDVDIKKMEYISFSLFFYINVTFNGKLKTN